MIDARDTGARDTGQARALAFGDSHQIRQLMMHIIITLELSAGEEGCREWGAPGSD